MLVEFEVWKEKKDEKGLPCLYLLRSQSEKDLYCVVSIDDNVPTVLGPSFNKTNKDIDQEGWEKLSDSRKNIEKFLLDNMDAETLVEIENNFFKPDELNESKTVLIDFE